jgi:hypothetical protein
MWVLIVDNFPDDRPPQEVAVLVATTRLVNVITICVPRREHRGSVSEVNVRAQQQRVTRNTLSARSKAAPANVATHQQ